MATDVEVHCESLGLGCASRPGLDKSKTWHRNSRKGRRQVASYTLLSRILHTLSSSQTGCPRPSRVPFHERDQTNADGITKTKLRPIALLATPMKFIESIAVDQVAGHIGFRVQVGAEAMIGAVGRLLKDGGNKQDTDAKCTAPSTTCAEPRSAVYLAVR